MNTNDFPRSIWIAHRTINKAEEVKKILTDHAVEQQGASGVLNTLHFRKGDSYCYAQLPNSEAASWLDSLFPAQHIIWGYEVKITKPPQPAALSVLFKEAIKS